MHGNNPRTLSSFADAETLWSFLEKHYACGSFSFEVLDAWLRRTTEPISQLKP
jgi:hypothetical protein